MNRFKIEPKNIFDRHNIKDCAIRIEKDDAGKWVKYVDVKDMIPGPKPKLNCDCFGWVENIGENPTVKIWEWVYCPWCSKELK